MGVDAKRAESSIRVSLSWENTLEEIPVAIRAMKAAIQKLQDVER